MDQHRIPSIHPGQILQEEFLEQMNLSQNRLAIEIKVPARRINEIVLGKRKITPDTALRLAKYFNMSPQFWLGLQMDYELEIASDKLLETIEAEVGVYKKD